MADTPAKPRHRWSSGPPTLVPRPNGSNRPPLWPPRPDRPAGERGALTAAGSFAIGTAIVLECKSAAFDGHSGGRLNGIGSMHSTRNWRIGWPTIWLWLFTAAVVAVAFMNWREHTSRSYLVNDDLPQLLRSTVFIDLSGTFHCGNKAVPAGLALGYEGMHTIDDSLRRPRLVDVTTVCIRPAAWNAEPDSTGRRETFAWLAEQDDIQGPLFLPRRHGR